MNARTMILEILEEGPAFAFEIFCDMEERGYAGGYNAAMAHISTMLKDGNIKVVGTKQEIGRPKNLYALLEYQP